MALYLVWLEDRARQYVEIEATNAIDARRKVEDMLDDGTLFDNALMQCEQSLWEVSGVEPAR